MKQISIDVGGTFTDCLVVDEHGVMHEFKASTTPHDPALGLLDALAKAATSFEQLLQTATTDLAVLLDVDVVTIGVESSTAPTARLPIHGIHLLKAGTVDALLGGERDVVLRGGVRGDPILFGAAAGLVQSQALMRLSFGRTAPVGLLCIGTRDPSSLPPGLGTELLGFLARALGITIRQWLDPAD